MKTFKQAMFTLFHILVTAYTVLLLFLCVLNSVHGQSTYTPQNEDHYKLGTVEERVKAIEEMRLDQRLIRIEILLSHVDDRDWSGNLANGGVGLLLIRALYLAIKNRDLTT